MLILMQLCLEMTNVWFFFHQNTETTITEWTILHPLQTSAVVADKIVADSKVVVGAGAEDTKEMGEAAVASKTVSETMKIDLKFSQLENIK